MLFGASATSTGVVFKSHVAESIAGVRCTCASAKAPCKAANGSSLGRSSMRWSHARVFSIELNRCVKRTADKLSTKHVWNWRPRTGSYFTFSWWQTLRNIFHCLLVLKKALSLNKKNLSPTSISGNFLKKVIPPNPLSKTFKSYANACWTTFFCKKEFSRPFQKRLFENSTKASYCKVIAGLMPKPKLQTVNPMKLIPNETYYLLTWPG